MAVDWSAASCLYCARREENDLQAPRAAKKAGALAAPHPQSSRGLVTCSATSTKGGCGLPNSQGGLPA